MALLSRLRDVSRRCNSLRPLFTRSFGAALARLDYDYDYYSDEETEPSRELMLGSEGVGRGVQWVILGEPGAKKHVYAERLSKLLEVPHISMGSLVRQELNPHSSLYKQIANAVNQGCLVPEDIVFGLLSSRLEEGYYRGETGFILDGIPRNRIQAEILDQITDIDLVLNFKCTEKPSLRQHLGSGTCSSCRGFHSRSELGPNKNLSFNENHSTTDSGTLWSDKICVYEEQSKPLEEYYRKQEKLLDFQVAGAPAETWQGLLAALHLQHVDAVSSSQKLTA